MDLGAMVPADLTAVPAGTRVDAQDLEGALGVPQVVVVADPAPDLVPAPEVRRPERAVLPTCAGIPPRLRPAMDAVRGVMIGVMGRRNS